MLDAIVLSAHLHRPTGKQRRQHREVLAQMADRVGETQAETGFDDRLMAQADAEREPVRARLLNGECLLGEHGRMSRERRYHVAAQLDARRHWAQCPQQDQRIRRTDQRNARRPDTVEAVRRPQSPVSHRSYGSLR